MYPSCVRDSTTTLEDEEAMEKQPRGKFGGGSEALSSSLITKTFSSASIPPRS